MPSKVVDVEKRKANAALKAAWLEQILLDQTLKHSTHRIGSFIAWRFDKDIGLSIVGRLTIAERLGITDKTVDSGIAELEAGGHIAVKRSTGRGHANEYTMLVKTAKAISPFEPEKASHASPFEASERAKCDARKGEIYGEKGRRRFRPLPSTSRYYSRSSRRLTTGDIAREVARQLHEQELASAEAVEPSKIVTNQGSDSWRMIPFSDRGRYQRDLAARLPGDPISNFTALSELPEDRLQAICRRQRNSPDTIDLNALQLELMRNAAQAG